MVNLTHRGLNPQTTLEKGEKKKKVKEFACLVLGLLGKTKQINIVCVTRETQSRDHMDSVDVSLHRYFIQYFIQ